jgi:hypothetical protein
MPSPPKALLYRDFRAPTLFFLAPSPTTGSHGPVQARTVFGHFPAIPDRAAPAFGRAFRIAQPFKDPKSGRFFVSFSYRDKRYKRSTGSTSLSAAKRAQRIIDGRVAQLKAGLASLPAGVKAEEFVLDNKETADEPSESLTVAGSIEQYLKEASSPPAKAAP